MEQAHPGGESSRLTITHEEVLRDPGLWGRYWSECQALIDAGQPVWRLQSSYTDDPGSPRPNPKYDYYAGGDWHGYVDGTEEDGFVIYVPGSLGKFYPFGGDPVGLLSEAQERLADYVRELSAR